MAALPPGVGLLHGGAAWRQLSAALLALASLAAAAAWLGYVPAQLLQAAAKRLAAAEPPVLAAAGLEGAAAAVQQQAAAAAAAAEGSGGGEDSDGLGGAALDWYRLDEKLQLFSSVLRLLTCNSIEQRGGTPGLPSAGGSGARSIGGQQEAPADLGLADSGSSTLVRQQALLLLQQQQDAGPLRSVRCVSWPHAVPLRLLARYPYQSSNCCRQPHTATRLSPLPALQGLAGHSVRRCQRDAATVAGTHSASGHGCHCRGCRGCSLPG